MELEKKVKKDKNINKILNKKELGSKDQDKKEVQLNDSYYKLILIISAL